MIFLAFQKIDDVFEILKSKPSRRMYIYLSFQRWHQTLWGMRIIH